MTKRNEGMARKSNSKDLYDNMKGWEIKYLQQAEKYGHLDAGSSSKHNTNKQSRRYNGTSSK